MKSVKNLGNTIQELRGDLDRLDDVFSFFFFQAEDGIRDHCVTAVQTCALPIWPYSSARSAERCGRHAARGPGVSVPQRADRPVPELPPTRGGPRSRGAVGVDS